MHGRPHWYTVKDVVISFGLTHQCAEDHEIGGARRFMPSLSVNGLGYSEAEAARYLEVNKFCVTIRFVRGSA